MDFAYPPQQPRPYYPSGPVAQYEHPPHAPREFHQPRYSSAPASFATSSSLAFALGRPAPMQDKYPPGGYLNKYAAPTYVAACDDSDHYIMSRSSSSSDTSSVPTGYMLDSAGHPTVCASLVQYAEAAWHPPAPPPGAPPHAPPAYDDRYVQYNDEPAPAPALAHPGASALFRVDPRAAQPPYHHPQLPVVPSSASAHAHASTTPYATPPANPGRSSPKAGRKPAVRRTLADRPPSTTTPMACLFCRKRKIACGPAPQDGAEQKSCKECKKRNQVCEYPAASSRGRRKTTKPSAPSAPAQPNVTPAAGDMARNIGNSASTPPPYATSWYSSEVGPSPFAATT